MALQSLDNLRKDILSHGEGNGTPLQYSCLENPIGRGAWQATVHRVAESQTRQSTEADKIISSVSTWTHPLPTYSLYLPVSPLPPQPSPPFPLHPLCLFIPSHYSLFTYLLSQDSCGHTQSKSKSCNQQDLSMLLITAH